MASHTDRMTQTTDAALVERLKAMRSTVHGSAFSAMTEAADTIEAQARRIEALEGALRPFAKAGELFGEPLPGEYEEGIYNPAAGPEYGFGAHALRAARAALEPTP